MKRTIKTTKAQKVPMEKLLFQLEMVLFQLDGCSLQPGYQLGKIPWHGLLQPLCAGPPLLSPQPLSRWGRTWLAPAARRFRSARTVFSHGSFQLSIGLLGAKRRGKKFILSLVWVGPAAGRVGTTWATRARGSRWV